MVLKKKSFSTKESKISTKVIKFKAGIITKYVYTIN